MLSTQERKPMAAEDFELRLNPPDEDFTLSNPYWYMVLSNGETVYQNQDDLAKPAWLNLKRYLEATQLRITRVVFKFRSHEIHFEIRDNIEWIYFCRGIGKEWMANDPDKFFVVGWQNTPNTIQKYWYKLPELVEFQVVEENLDKAKLNEEFIHFMPTLDTSVNS